MKKGLSVLLICVVVLGIAGYLYDQNQRKIRYQQYLESESLNNDENETSDKNTTSSECLDCAENTTIDENNSNNENIQPETQTQRQWVNCNVCHGTGLKQCYECRGLGQVDCSTTPIYSYQCDGCENRKPCPQCNGTGSKKCYNCYGTGNKGNCDNCNGRGQVQM